LCDPSFPWPQAITFGKTEPLAQPIWDYLDGGTHQHSLHPKKRLRQHRRFAHDLKKLEYDRGWLQPVSHKVE
jgi:hypothetical protein